MHNLTLAILEDCTQGSDEDRLTFPQVVGNLMSAGIERYHADLQRSEKTYYLPSGESKVLKTYTVAAQAAGSFSPSGVADAVRAIQKGQIKYNEFCERILAAGCVSYIVSLAGKRAVYYGRTGEAYVEMFPSAA